MGRNIALVDRPPVRKSQATRRLLRPKQWNTPIIGWIVAVSEVGGASVQFEKNPSRQPVPARSGVPIRGEDVGASVVLLFDGGDPSRPIIISRLISTEATPQPVHVVSDGESLMLSANQQIVLQCGKASITLTRAGKIILRGAYLLSRSSGVNRIKGGSVQIN